MLKIIKRIWGISKKIFYVLLVFGILGLIGGILDLIENYFFYFILLLLLLVVYSFIINNKGKLIVEMRYKIAEVMLWLHNFLFKGGKPDRFLSWYILLAILNNFIIEPLSHMSSKIPYGNVQSIPKIYSGIWIAEENDDYKSRLLIKDSKMTYTYTWFEDNSKEKIKCESPEIFYNFHTIEYKLNHYFWYPVIDVLLHSFVPDTIFGSQYIYWTCDIPTINNLNYLSISEPSIYFFGETRIMLHKPYSRVGFDGNDYIEYYNILYGEKSAN